MGDLKSPKLIIIKGLLFFAMGLLAAVLLLMHAPSLTVATLLAVTVWSFCRFYYFTFYVIERYVDSSYRFTGIYDAVCFALRRLAGARSKTDD